VKSVSTALKDTLKYEYAVRAVPGVIAEWNQNRYARIQSIDNDPTEASKGYDADLFPISSIAEQNRPYAGILKAIVRDYETGVANIVDGYSSAPGNARSYIASTDDKYKHWCAPVASSIPIGGGRYGFTETIKPHIIYQDNVWTNKIVVTFESTLARPVDYAIELSYDGVNWDAVAANIVPDQHGQVILYRQSDDSWAAGVYRENPVQIRGIRLIVTSINKNNDFFQLIELSPRLESDLSQFLINYDASFSMSESSFITPLGVASSNTGSITLSNIDGRFNSSNSSSLYYGLIDKNVKFVVYVDYYTESGYDRVQSFEMFADEWTGQADTEVTVAVKDYSKYLQEVKPSQMLMEQTSAGEIIWSLCDSVGFNRYIYEPTAQANELMVPYFWIDGEETVWEIIAKLAEMTQTAVFFDEYGYLRILPRDRAYNESSTVAWEFDATENGSKLPDIQEIDIRETYEANAVSVNYKTTKTSDYNNGLPQMEIVWEPEDSLVLRSSPLGASVGAEQDYLKIKPSDVVHWPYSGLLQLNGEFMRYDGKQYTYYDKSGVKITSWIMSAEQKNVVDKTLSHVDYAYKNAFTGYLRIVKRGEFNTVGVLHSVDANGWYNRHTDHKSAINVWDGGFTHQKDQSTITLASTRPNFNGSRWYVSTRNYIADAAQDHFGARLQFVPDQSNHGCGGILFWNNNTNGQAESGYYVELIRTAMLNSTHRKYHHELNVYAIYSNGTQRRLGPNGGAGITTSIISGNWYDLDIRAVPESDGDHISISLNGIPQFSLVVPNGQRITPTGRSGLFTRGHTTMKSEYFYAVQAGATYRYDPDIGTFYDKVRGGWASGQWDVEWTWNWSFGKRLYRNDREPVQHRAMNRFFDDFGPYVHEIREFDVQFEKSPVLHSQLYFSNTSQVFCPEYVPTAFGAKFLLANKSRVNAVVSGEDTLTFGADNPVEQKALIYGRLLYKEDEKSVEFTNDDSIRRRGRVEVEVSGDLYQSEHSARVLGEWITKHWAEGSDELEIQSFGNTLVQLGDRVSVRYPLKGMQHSTHQYFVVEKRESWSEGVETSFVLRRVR
jgi:hypothetical protein